MESEAHRRHTEAILRTGATMPPVLWRAASLSLQPRLRRAGAHPGSRSSRPLACATQLSAAVLAPVALAAHQLTYSLWSLASFLTAPLEQAALTFLPAARSEPALDSPLHHLASPTNRRYPPALPDASLQCLRVYLDLKLQQGV